MAVENGVTHARKKPFNVAIVGGGIAGAALALNLLSKDVPVTIYEAAPQFGEIGAGVSFGANATRVLKLISPYVYKAFDDVANRNDLGPEKDTWFDFRYGHDCGEGKKDGELIAKLSCRGGQASVHRAHFLDGMVKFLPAGLAKFGKRAIGFQDLGEEQGVVITFDDGTQATHDAVLGCDGIKSQMRLALLGATDPAARATYSGKYCYRGLVPMQDAKEILGESLAINAQMYLGDHGHVLTFPIDKGRTMNVVAFASSETWDDSNWVVDAEREAMEKDFAHFGSDVRAIISLMKKTTIWALFNHPPARTLNKGRIALIGDAAHATTPHCGAGAGMAIEDAYIIGNLLGDVESKSELARVFEVYDQVRRERSLGLVERSRKQGQTLDFGNPACGNEKKEIGDWLTQNMNAIWQYDIEEELAQARRLVKDA